MTRNYIAATLVLFFTLAFGCLETQAVEMYWDINGASSGAGGATPSGTWSTSTANWSTDPNGEVATAAWTNNNQATFSAGGEGTGAFTVTIGAGSPTVRQVSGPGGHSGVRIDAGHITLAGANLTVDSVAFGGGFTIAPGASLSVGATTILRTGTNNRFSYMYGGGTFYMPGFSSISGGSNPLFIVPSGGAWDFGSTPIVANRTVALSGSLVNPAVIQGSGTMSRTLQNSNGGTYFSGGSGGGFAARGGTLDVTFTGGTVTFGGGGSVNPNNGSPLILGSPTADSLVDFKSNLILGTESQNIMAWNPDNNTGNIGRISGIISGGTGGALNKIGTGTLQLTAANTYSGGTTVTEGTLLLNNSTGSATGSGAISVALNGILGGTGSTTGSVDVLGTLAPGESTESLSIGNLTMQSSSTLEIELGGLTPGAAVSGYDQLNVTGTLNLDNATLDLSTIAFTPEAGDTFYILNNDGVDSITGTFAGLANNSKVSLGGYNWFIRYDADFGTQNFAGGIGNDIALQLAPIPEPSMFSLLVLGCLGGMLQRRRRRKLA